MKWLKKHKLIRFALLYLLALITISTILELNQIARGEEIGELGGVLFWFFFIPYCIITKRGNKDA